MEKKRILGYWSKKIPGRRIFQIVPLCMILIVGLMLALSATGIAQTVLLKGATFTSKALFDEVERQTDKITLFSNNELDMNRKVKFEAGSYQVNELYQKILKGTNLEMQLKGDYIVIKKTDEKMKSEDQQQKVKQEVVLRGKVTDKSGLAMPGVSVYIEGTTIGVATDIQGNYVLPVEKEKCNIVFSFIGMRTMTFAFNAVGPLVHNVVMIPEDAVLDDVVVIGYGSKSSRDLTSSVSKVSSDQLVKSAGAASTSFDNMLGGSVKGVLVSQGSGRPGASATLNIRGVTSPLGGSSEPLYVIDGVPFFNDNDPTKNNFTNPLMTISPNDIESIDVLKDAAATSIYGSRGANGVVIVKTKTGRRNEKMSVTLGYTASVGNFLNMYKPLNANQFKEVQGEIIRNMVDDSNQGGYTDPNRYLPYGKITMGDDGMYTYSGVNDAGFGKADVNWVDEVRNRNAMTHSYDFAIRGGSEHTNYSFSFNGTDQEGLYIKDKLHRYGARLSVDTDITRRIKTGASLGYTFTKRNNGDSQSGQRPWIARPDISPYDETGEFNRFPTLDLAKYANPLARILGSDNESRSYQFTGNSYLEFEVVRNLKLRGDINLSNFQNEASNFTAKTAKNWTPPEFGSPLVSNIMNMNNAVTNTSVNFRADYQVALGLHQFNAMVGYGWDRTFSQNSTLTFQDFLNDKFLNDISSAKEVTDVTNYKVTNGLNSVYARLGYIYADKYLAEVNFRSDASSKFGPGNKRGYFPSVSLGWRMNNEGFMANADWVNDLKFRFSVGQTGSTNVSDFSYKQYYSRDNRNMWGGESSISPGRVLPNTNVKWEMTTEQNGGVDFSFFNYRLKGSVDAYYRYTSGALAAAPIIVESGFTTFTTNLIDMSNKGLEVEIGGDIIRKKDWNWHSQFNISFNRNKLDKFNGASLDWLSADSYQEGYPAGILKGLRVEKIFQTQEEIAALDAKTLEATNGEHVYFLGTSKPGDYKYMDLNGDGYVDEKDKTVIATPEPKFFGGFFNSVSYRNLSLSFMFQFSKGASASMSSLPASNFNTMLTSIEPELYRNTWTPERTNARYARLTDGDPGMNDALYTGIDRYVYETSYLRLKNITLSYDLSKVWLNRINLQGVQVFASASNLWTLTQWPGIDPELVGGGAGTGFGGGNGVSNGDPYPLSRTFSFGVKVQF